MSGWKGQSERHSEALKKAWLKRETRWTEEEILLLKTIFPKTDNKTIAKILKRAETATKVKASRLKLRKDREWLISLHRNKNSGQYKKGNKPWITGRTKENDVKIRNMSELRKGKDNPAYDYLIKAWQDPDYRTRTVGKALKALMDKPTKPERKLIQIMKNYNLPFDYVGNGVTIIGELCPDFIQKEGKKRIIEVFGRAFHNPDFSFRKEIPWHQQYFGRTSYYAQLGYSCLILWDNEIFELAEGKIAEKIARFIGE